MYMHIHNTVNMFPQNANNGHFSKMEFELFFLDLLLSYFSVKFKMFTISMYVFLFMAAPGHMDVSQLGVESEPAYATATQDPSCIFDLHHSLQQHQILNPLSKARY